MRPPRSHASHASLDRRIRRRAATGVAAAAALLVAAPAAHAAGCAVTPASTIFSSLGDLANYTLAPGGNFESGTTGWTLKGASVVSGNDTVALGAKGTKSLSITPTGTATSAPFCVGVEHPSFRFAARQSSGSWATMLVAVRWTDSTGKVNTTTVGSINGTSTWTVAVAQKLATALPLWQAGQSITAQIVFDPIDSGGGFQVDDLYIDPYRRS